MRFRRLKCCFAHTEKTDQRHSVGGHEKFEIRNSTTWVRFVFQECSQDVYGKSLELWDIFFLFWFVFLLLWNPKILPWPPAQRHSTCQLRLTLYKLTSWLASLDLCKPYTICILSHRIASRSRDPPRLPFWKKSLKISILPVTTKFFQKCVCYFWHDFC